MAPVRYLSAFLKHFGLENITQVHIDLEAFYRYREEQNLSGASALVTCSFFLGTIAHKEVVKIHVTFQMQQFEHRTFNARLRTSNTETRRSPTEWMKEIAAQIR